MDRDNTNKKGIYLNIGCGDKKLPGFINIDIDPNADVQQDVTNGLPFEADSIAGIFSEHFFEHITQAEGINFLRECRRVLKSGGIVRIATPDLDALIDEYQSDRWLNPEWAKFGYNYLDNRCEMLNLALREWGHQWVYNEEELTRLAESAGLTFKKRCKIGVSDHPKLRNLEYRDGSRLILEFVNDLPQKSKTPPLVSVLIPAYKSKFFEECLQSALAQAYKNLEIIICDDNESAEIQKIVSRYSKNDQRIRYYKNKKTLGGYENHLKCFSLAKGRYIKFLSDDDLLKPNGVTRMVDCLENYPRVTLVTSHRQRIDENGHPLPEKPETQRPVSEDSLINGMSFANAMLSSRINFIGEPTTVMFRKRDLEGTKPDILSFGGRRNIGNGDMTMWVNLLSRGDAIYLVDSLSCFRIHDEQEQNNEAYAREAKGQNAIDQLIFDARRMGFLDPRTPMKLNVRPLNNSFELVKQQVQEYLRNQDSDTALRLLKTFVQTNTEHAAAQNELGILCFKTGKKKAALECFEKSIKLQPDDLTVQQNLADLYLDLNDLPKAIAKYVEILSQAPEDEHTLLQLGQIYQQQGNLTKAVFYYRQLARLKPGDQELEKIIQKLTGQNNKQLTKAQSKVKPKGRKGIKTKEIDLSQAENETNQIRVSIIIPVFNKVDFTKKCLETLYKNTPPENQFEVIVVDNGSGDGTAAFLRKFKGKHSHFHIVTHQKNQGFSKGCNAGAAKAAGEFLLFLNNDTEPRAGWLDALVEIADNDPSVTAVGSKLIFPDGKIQHAGVIVVEDHETNNPFLPMHRFYQAPENEPEAAIPYECQALTAACLLVRKAAFMQVGGFDEAFWNCLEDVDLCFKLRNQGGKLVYQPKSVLIHHESQSGPERFRKIAENDELLKKRWLGIIKPDFEVKNDGRFYQKKPALIGPYSVPQIVRKNQQTITGRLVSIIIPVFNKVEYTQQCLETIFSLPPENVPFEVIVVDNASTDDTPSYLIEAEKQFSGLRVVTHRENLGFARACNAGAGVAKGNFLLFLNNDTEPQPGWLREMLKIFDEQSDVGIVGAKLLYPTGTIQHAGIEFHYRTFENKLRPWPYHEFLGLESRVPEVDQTRDVIAVTGACLMIPRSLFHSVGEFDEKYQMYFEDIDLNLKVRQRGKKIVYCHTAVVIHYEGVSSQAQEEIDQENLRSYEIFYSRWKDYLEKYLNSRVQLGHQVLWSAPFFNPSGYASEAIGFSLGLDAYTQLRILHTNPMFSKTFVQSLPLHWKNTLFRLTGDDPKSKEVNIAKDFIFISHQPGHSLGRLEQARYNIGRTMFETDRVPELWIEPCNRMDEIWVPSHFNVETFSKAGIDPQKLFVVPEGIDTAVFNPDIVEPLELPNRAGFNFLSIFEWTERKGWDVLLKAYFEAFSNEDDVCLYLRTYLLGHYDSDTEEILRAKIDELIQRKGYDCEKLPRFELMPRQLPFREMLQLYKAADAFVLPSRGEGWGRPYMEAMAMGLPVIGTNWSGNTEFMTAENSYLIRVQNLVKIKKMEIPFYIGHRWAQPSKHHLKKLMREVFEDPQAAKEVGRKARKDVIEKYSNKAVALVALRRLQQIEKELDAGKTHPVPEEKPQKAIAAAASPEKSKELPQPTECAVKWEGSQFVYHSFGLINREIATRLLESGVKLSAIPYEPDQYQPRRNSRFAKLRKAVTRRLKNVDVHVRHQWPPDLSAPKDGHWVVIQPWEFGSTPKEWVRVFSEQVDEVWVPSNFVRNVYVRDGIPAEKVFVIPNGIDPKKFHPGVKPYPLKTRKSLKLLFVGGTIYRKGIDLLLEAYLKAFTREDDVCLVIKDICKDSFYKGRNFADKVKEIQNDPRAPEIEYIDDVLPEAQLIGLYTACDALVHPYRGEGFGLPILEAMACGIPAIVPRGGACLDFCDDSNSLFINAGKAFLPEAKIGERETIEIPYILEPDVTELISQMKKAQKEPALLKKLGEKASKDARANWTWDIAAAKALERIRTLKTQPVQRFSQALTGQMEDAREFQETGNFSVARERFEAIYQSTGHLPALYSSAECAFRNGETENALNVLNTVLQLNPNFAAAYLLKGEILQSLAQPEKAASEFLAAWQVDPTLVSGAINSAEMLLQNKPDDALKILNDVIQNSPETEDVYPKIMRILEHLGRSDEIPAMLQQGLEAQPDSRNLWGLLIDFLQDSGQEDAYRKTFAAFTKKFPDDPVVQNEQGVKAWADGDLEGAIAFFQKAVADAEPHPDHLKNLADAYLATENFEGALQVLIDLLQKFPEDIEAYQKMANLYIENGDYESAKSLLAKALEYHPENQYLRDWRSLLDTPEVYLAYQMVNQGEFENGRSLFETYLMENPDDVSARLGLGSVLFFQKEFDAAEELYLGTLTDNPDAEEALVYLAKIYVARKDEDKLNALKTQHPRAFQKTPELRKAYVDILLAHEHFDEAVNELVQYIREFPGDADGYFLLGSLYLECGRKDDANRCFSKASELDPDNASLNEVIDNFMTEVAENDES